MRQTFLIMVGLLIAFCAIGQTSPHEKSFQIDCTQCHTSESWKVNPTTIKFDHNNTGFKLEGQHRVANCTDCHKNLTFKDGRRNCLDCHTDVHNQSLGKLCDKCHTPRQWVISDITVMHQQTRFPLLGAHKTVNCAGCHKSASVYQYETLGIECVNCHNEDFLKTTTPNHVSGKYSTFCLECHNENTSSWKAELPNHDAFPLKGGHNVGCGDCHTTGRYGKLATDCNSCHNKQFVASQLPKHSAAGIPVKCETCHSTTSWKPSSFNHLTSSGYELKGAHKNVIQCSDCHKGILTSAKQTCVSCHQSQFELAPNHKKAGFPEDCTKCHSQANWVENTFNHSTTIFPLTGAHQTTKCIDCHISTLKGTAVTCSACHLTVYTNSKLPAHVAAGIPKECATCHSTNSWKPSSFNHSSTGYELKGAHKSVVQCADCHKGSVTTASQTCSGCHQARYDAAPNHKPQGYPTDCTICHTQTNWISSGFDHTKTNFPLTGGHTKVLCKSCHITSFTGTPVNCNGCHIHVYNSAKLPDHSAAGIPKECATCHTTISWKPSSFNHNSTGYELKGAHKNVVQCADCHKGSVTTTLQTCVSCHQAKYDAALGHKQSAFSTDCTKCHNHESWVVTNFDHSTTRYPLTGAHSKVTCKLCHVTGYVGTTTICSNCHLPAYNSSQSPGHQAAGIPKECVSCHSTSSWRPSSFNHSLTGYELKGAHKSVMQCSDCHKGSVTTTLQTCISCHQAKYDAALGHRQGAFSTECTKCHTQDNWVVTNFDHTTTRYPLTGAHIKAPCKLCHVTGYVGTTTVCGNCHLPAYTSSQSPGHQAAGIPKECASCHSTSSWRPSSFNHISTGYELKGAHRSVVQCSDCHKGSVTTTLQTCVSCHLSKYDAALGHKQSAFSTDCTRCHTQDSWVVTNFDHTTTKYPLTGAHIKAPCKSCHVTTYVGTTAVCSNCHLPVYNSSISPGHSAAGIPKECASCHTTTSWRPSSFNHTSTGYELKGAHKRVVQCSDCHKGSVSTTLQGCVSCHQVKYDAALGHKQGAFSTDCTKCHSQDSWVVTNFDHSTTKYPLTGAHTKATCKLCHVTSYVGTTTVCSNCHLTAYNSSISPGHSAAGIPKECATCHSTTSWRPSSFNHTSTGYELKGAHKSVVQCSECHKGSVTTTLQTCISCHQSRYDAALGHKQGAFSTDCTKCHTQDSWVATNFDHSTTKYPLTGAHTKVLCKSCHVTTYVGTTTVCGNCHLQTYNTSQAPGHASAGLPKECINCHSTASWKPSSFNHTTTGYELRGAHKTIVQCSSCHKGNVTSAPQTCIGCHQSKYDAALGHKQGSFSLDCVKCHTQENWLVINFDHSVTKYPLTGAHTKVLCKSCHVTTYVGTSTVCSNCHLSAYTSSQSPGHATAGIPRECATCHITASWKPSSFNHSTTGYELKGAHKTIVQCSSCHKGNVTSAPQTCYGCHQAKYETGPSHKAQGYPTDCAMCHSQNNWLENTFNHAVTSFPLTGSHTSVVCVKCHTTGFKGTPTTCGSCHLPAYNNSQLPGHAAAGIPKECATCHTSASWKPSGFNHTTTGYELKGAHKTIVQCSSCHKGNVTSAAQTCIGCHQTKYDAALGHKQGAFSTDCTKCHSQDNWLVANFDHSVTRYPLTGAHTKVLCKSCHATTYSGTTTVCGNCHLAAYTSSQSPGHAIAGIPKECATCHTTASWKPSSFNHTATGYELKGAHRTIVQCSSCHKGNVTSAPQTCIGCHQAKYDVGPSHKAQGYPTDCTLCHSQNNWLENTFNHAVTAFPLTGAHSSALCLRCHTNGFKGTPTICSSCHLPAYTSSQLPGHVAAGIPKECATCHTSASWKPSAFNHSTTGYVLNGAHKSIAQCSSCHKGNLTTASLTCVGCHQARYDAAPGHKTQGYPTDCTICHSQNNWLESTFNHAVTAFPLSGAHSAVLCSKCHTAGFKGTSTVCSSCHLPAYTSSLLPGHVAAGIPKECATCHTSASWKPSSFNHTTTGYVLNGAHKTIAQCSSCHKGNLTTAPLTCAGCHQSRFDAAPGHKTQGYPTDCTICHSQNNWLESTFNHATTSFPLTGAHSTVLCAKCHTTAFKGTPTACFSCHSAKYNATVNPNHVTAKFPTNCESCHKTTAWTPATYNHDAQYFPIYSGKHRGAWTLCSDCHTVATNYASFSCISCHEHSSKTSVDKDHNGVKNYSYVSSACYSCHPTGR